VFAAALRRAPVIQMIVWIERFLRRPQSFGDVLEVHANSRPRGKASAHRIHENVGRLKVRGRIGMT
jgi:hypothetical protein